MIGQQSLDDIIARTPEPPLVLISGPQVRIVPDVRDKRRPANPERLSGDQMLVLLAHSRHPQGLTDFELGASVGRAQTSAGKRRVELERAGLIEFTGARRATGGGGTAGVYRITADGLALAIKLKTRAAA